MCTVPIPTHPASPRRASPACRGPARTAGAPPTAPTACRPTPRAKCWRPACPCFTFPKHSCHCCLATVVISSRQCSKHHHRSPRAAPDVEDVAEEHANLPAGFRAEHAGEHAAQGHGRLGAAKPAEQHPSAAASPPRTPVRVCAPHMSLERRPRRCSSSYNSDETHWARRSLRFSCANESCNTHSRRYTPMSS